MTAETTRFHNRLQKLALAVEESRLYWQAARPDLAPAEENRQAFAERWFGGKSAAWVAVLLTNFRARYGAFPEALEVLRQWRPADPATRRLVCHWHLQLTDPYYRRFTGEYLTDLRDRGGAEIDFDTVLHWVIETKPKPWQPSSCRQVASRLLAAASEAGLLSVAPDPRRVLTPHVPDEALGYILHLLRQTAIAQPLLANDYLGSVGLSGVFLDQRLRVAPWVRVQRMGDVVSAEWQYQGLRDWAEAIS
ncbi:MAG: hypothetical protein VR70_08030 [Rhodospirillaceae bacterium BRH_c57]|nr:MAG: hypothetical protein VR70_08030 [Rhodospirillaceae bacterium BRH_c57]